VARSGERAVDLIRMCRYAIVPLGRGSCYSQNHTSICCLGLRRAFAEDWVCVLCQSRNNSWWASGVWSPSHSGLLAGPGSLRTEW